jgi:hypothetical protein
MKWVVGRMGGMDGMDGAGETAPGVMDCGGMRLANHSPDPLLVERCRGGIEVEVGDEGVEERVVWFVDEVRGGMAVGD